MIFIKEKGKRYMALLIVCAMMLTGCSGGEEEPAATTNQEVEADATTSISRKDLLTKYNECSALFNEVEDALMKNGTYNVEADVKADMDYIYDLLGMAEVVVQSEDISDDEAISVYNELQTHIDKMNEFKDTFM